MKNKEELLNFSIIAASLFFIITAIEEIEAAPEQIAINPNNIQNLTAFGQTDNPLYPEFYPPKYLFDLLENSYSFWTQQGKSGFDLILKQKLDKPICSVEIGVSQPQNTPFSLIINDKLNFDGILNSQKVTGNLKENNNNVCVSDVSKISMKFNPPDLLSWTTIPEIKLFSLERDGPPPPPVDPPVNATKITISNSKVDMDLTGSQVTIKVTNDQLLTLSKNQIIKQTTEPIQSEQKSTSIQQEENENDEEDDEDNDDDDKDDEEDDN